MEKTLVLRLLIYGIITQVSDKENACGKGAGAATSFRRPDGITIVCLPLPSDRATGSTQTSDSSKDVNSLSSHGITLRITPNEEKLIIETKANYKEGEEEEKKPKSAAFKAPKSSDELEYSTTTIPLDLEKPKKGKGSKKAEPEEPDADKEEEDEDGDIRNKRKAKEDVKPPPKRKELFERSTVEYETTTSSPAAEEEPEEEEEPEPEKPPVKEKTKPKAKDTTEKPKVKAPREAPFEKLEKGGKKQSLSLASLQDLLGGNENDDEVEQYILIRRRKKRPPPSSSSGRESASLDSQVKPDLMLPLASSEATTSSSSSSNGNKHHNDNNNNKAIKGSKMVTIELVNETRQRRGLKQRRTKRRETTDDSVPANGAKTSGKADKGKMTDKGEEGDKRIRRRRRQRGDQLPSRKNEELKEESKPQVTVETSQREPTVDYGQRIKRRKSEASAVTTDGQTKTKTKKKKRKTEQVKQIEESAASETITDAASTDKQSSRMKSRKKSKSKRNSEDESEQTTTTTTTTTTTKRPKKSPKRKKKKPKKIEKESDDQPDVKASKPKAKRHSEDNEIEASKGEKSGPQWAKLGKHQIFIIHVPITQHNKFTTTLTAPTKETGAREEEKFSDFLKHFNFSPADGVVHGEEVKSPSSDEDGRDKRESQSEKNHGESEKNPPKKKKKKPKKDEPIQDRDEQYGGVAGKTKKKSKTKKKEKKKEAEEKEKPRIVASKKPDTIGDLWGSKEEAKERQEPEAEKPKAKKRKTSKRKPCDDKEKEAEPEAEPEAKGKVVKPNKEEDSVFQLLKVAHISVDGESNSDQSAKKQQNGDDDPTSADFGGFDFEQAKTWPAKNGHFKEEFNHSFRYDKETGSGHKSFKAFGDKGKVTTEKEDGESPAEEKAKNEDIIWGMIKKMQNVPWFKGGEEAPDNELASRKKRK